MLHLTYLGGDLIQKTIELEDRFECISLSYNLKIKINNTLSYVVVRTAQFSIILWDIK